jgi:pre-mRNA-processing factor 6
MVFIISFDAWLGFGLFIIFAGDHEAERSLILKAVAMFPNFAKLHMMLIQVYVHFQDVEAARQAYNKAVTLCPKSVQLWIVAAHMEQAVGA